MVSHKLFVSINSHFILLMNSSNPQQDEVETEILPRIKERIEELRQRLEKIGKAKLSAYTQTEGSNIILNFDFPPNFDIIFTRRYSH